MTALPKKTLLEQLRCGLSGFAVSFGLQLFISNRLPSHGSPCTFNDPLDAVSNQTATAKKLTLNALISGLLRTEG